MARRLDTIAREMAATRQKIRVLEAELSRKLTSGEHDLLNRIRIEMSLLQTKLTHLQEEYNHVLAASPRGRVRPKPQRR